MRAGILVIVLGASLATVGCEAVLGLKHHELGSEADGSATGGEDAAPDAFDASLVPDAPMSDAGDGGAAEGRRPRRRPATVPPATVPAARMLALQAR
jgi:hypothetical protein